MQFTDNDPALGLTPLGSTAQRCHRARACFQAQVRSHRIRRITGGLDPWRRAGLIGAGTNNARLAGMLRSLSSYYYKEAGMLFLVRVAQGLVHLGKGLLGLAPYHTDGQLLSGAQGHI